MKNYPECRTPVFGAYGYSISAYESNYLGYCFAGHCFRFSNRGPQFDKCWASSYGTLCLDWLAALLSRLYNLHIKWKGK